jgi:hypothetical protein
MGGERLPFGSATKNINIKIRRGLKWLQKILKNETIKHERQTRTNAGGGQRMM